MTASDDGAYAAFREWLRRLEADELPIQLLRPKPVDPESAFDGDYDFIHDPRALDRIVRAALHACTAHPAAAIVQQSYPHKTRILFLAEEAGDRRILIELWPHAELALPGALRRTRRGAIPWRALNPHRGRDGWLPAELLALLYVTHLHYKAKDLRASEVTDRLRAFRGAVTASPDVSAIVEGLLTGARGLDEANQLARHALGKRGITPHVLPLAIRHRLPHLVRRRLSSLGGRRAVILGADGSGKSTLIGAVMQASEGAVGTYVFKHIYRRSKTFSRAHRALTRVSGAGVTSPRNVREEQHPHLLLTTALLRWPLRWVRQAATPRTARARVVLVDRYFWDYFLPVRSKAAPRRPVAAHRLYSRLTPRPANLVVLCCSTATLLARKQELTGAAIDALYDLYCAQISARRIPRVLLLSTELSLDRCAETLTRFVDPDPGANRPAGAPTASLPLPSSPRVPSPEIAS